MIQTFICGRAAFAASRMKRASSRGVVSFSPPIVRLIAASWGRLVRPRALGEQAHAVTVADAVHSEAAPDDVVRPHPADVLAGGLGPRGVVDRAEGACSSPANVAKTIVASNERCDITRASSST